MAIVGTAGGEIRHPRLHRGRPTSTPARPPWRTYTIPGTGEPGNETWKDGKDRWKHGGGSNLGDPRPTIRRPTRSTRASATQVLTGDPEYRPGDNKWAASVLAISPNDGMIKWGFQ